MFAVAAIAAGPGAACAQDYPVRPVRIATSEAGGAGDFASRVIGQGLVAALGQQVLVENRSNSAAEYVAKAPADGHTLLLYGNTIWIAPLLREVAWNATADFAPVMLTVKAPNVLVVTPSLPVKSVRELIALARARPGELNYASSTTGSSTHLAGELFNAMAGVNITRINYKGVSMAITDVTSGRVKIMFLAPAAVAPFIKSGKLRALAVTGAHSSPLFPGLPTIAAVGVPGYESGAYFGLFAPVRTPATLISRINRATASVLASPDVKERFFNAGMEIVSSSPEQFADFLKTEIAKWGKVIRSAGIRGD